MKHENHIGSIDATVRAAEGGEPAMAVEAARRDSLTGALARDDLAACLLHEAVRASAYAATLEAAAALGHEAAVALAMDLTRAAAPPARRRPGA